MEKSIKGTRTEKNLAISFAGESQARMRYTYFASAAKKEGFEQISAIFTETADQEKEHAKRMFKWLEGGMVEITAATLPAKIGTTLRNRKLLLPERIKNGHSIILNLLILLKKKDSWLLQRCIVKLQLLKKDMKKDTWLWLRM